MSTRANIRITAEDRTAAAFRKVNANLQLTQRATMGVTAAFGALKGAMGVLGLVQLGRGAVQAGLAMRRIETALKVVTGSAKGAREELNFLRDTTNRFGTALVESADAYTKFAAATKGTAIEGETTRKIFVGLSAAARTFGLTAYETEGALRGLTQMVSKGKVSMEEMNQVGERIPGFLDMVATSVGLTKEEFFKLGAQGKILADDVMPGIARAFAKFEEQAEEAANGPAADFERFRTTMVNLGAAFSTFLLPILSAVAKKAHWLAQQFWEVSRALRPIAELTMSELEGEITRVGTEVGRLKDGIVDMKAEMAGGEFFGDTTQLEIMEGQLEMNEAKLVQLQAALRKAEIATNGLEGSAADLGETTVDLSHLLGDTTDGLKDAAKAANTARDAYKSMFDVTTRNLRKSMDTWSGIHEELDAMFEEEKNIKVGVDQQSVFDMKEAMKNVQNNIQSGFSDLFYDVFSGKGVDSFKDFANRVFDIFKRLLADMAAAWAAAKIFNLPVNFGGGNVLGGFINGGGIGGGIGSGSGGGVGGMGSVAAIGKKVASWFGWGGGSTTTSAVPGALGSVKGPAVLNYAGGASSAAVGNGFGGGLAGGGGNVAASGSAWGSAAGAAVVAAIAAYGFSRIGKKQQVRAERQAEFFTGVGTGTTENLGGSAWDFRGMLDDATAFFSTTREGWQSTVEALKEAGVAAQGWGASLDENGRGLVKIQGDIAGVKSALSSAVATGYDFVGSLSNAIEKGNNLRVSIQGDAEAIESALQAATAMGIGGFVGLEKTANGVSATLTGNIQLWDQYLQGFVNEAISSAVNGVSALGGAASDATKDFLTLANAAARVKVGSTIGGGRSAQVDGSHDRGLTYVPRDGYVAELHRGERVLTAEENRGLSQAGMDDTRMVKAIERQTQVIRRQGRRADYTIGGR